MNIIDNRRTTLKQVLILCCALQLLSTSIRAQPRPDRHGEPRYDFTLNAFSFNDLLMGTDKMPDGKPFTIFDLLDWCADQGIRAVDLTGYYFPGYPEVPDDAFIHAVKQKAFLRGVEISGTGIRNNFASPDARVRAADVELAKKWIVVASKLGAPVIRLFAGAIPKGYENRWDEVAGWMIACYRECAAFGQQHGVMIGIQNHGDMLQTADQCIAVIKAVNSPWVGIIVDTGSFLGKDPYADIEAVTPYAVNWQVKANLFSPTSGVRTDFRRLVTGLERSTYRGYIPVETLKVRGKPYDPFLEVPQLIKELEEARRAVD